MTARTTAPSRHGTAKAWPDRCPSPDERVRLQIDPGSHVEFEWGPFWSFGSAAYWISQYLVRFGQKPIPNQAFGRNLLEETAACILGGYGVPAEIALLAFNAVRDACLLNHGEPTSVEDFFEILRKPLHYAPARHETEGAPPQRSARYRFAAQRAQRLATATEIFATHNPPESPKALRDWLLKIPGVGYKTASWILRNQTCCDEVAIIDIHLQRAGVVAGFFDSTWSLPRDYLRFERAFLLYCEIGEVPVSGLDALIWEERRVLTSNRPVSTWLCGAPKADYALRPLGYTS